MCFIQGPVTPTTLCTRQVLYNVHSTGRVRCKAIIYGICAIGTIGTIGTSDGCHDLYVPDDHVDDEGGK